MLYFFNSNKIKMVKKVTITIKLDDNVICVKKFVLEENLTSIREKIKSKVGNAIFLDKGNTPICIEDENDFKLEEIIKDDLLMLKSDENSSNNEINIILNDKKYCSKNISIKDSLQNLRNNLKKDIKNDFFFLDKKNNRIDENDEEDFEIEEILNNNSIKIESNEVEQKPAPIDSLTPQNKIMKKKNELKPKYDLSKYDFIKEEKGIKFYKYSKIQRVTDRKEKIYHYKFDDFSGDDYQKAYIILFIGKTGDGKSTSINSFFNIIKGIKLGDSFRFILIEEEEKKPGESITDGIHLYYLRDYNKHPLIIIDTQGYGDTRNVKYDEMITATFETVFSKVIDHINIVCFISKATEPRLDILTKYIFTKVTSLFSDDISENLIFLCTHANKDTMKKGPAIIKTIGSEPAFEVIRPKMDEKFWYSADNSSILSNDTDNLTLYSFKQLSEFYEEKVKKSRKKGVKNCSNVINYRKELSIQVNNLNKTFQNLMAENRNLKEKEKKIIEIESKIKEMILTIKNEEVKTAKLKGKDLENALKKLTDDLEGQLNELKNKKVPYKERVLDADSKAKHTYCNECKENCHSPCYCWFDFVFRRCTIYPIIGTKCECCGHEKCVHENGYKKYIWKTKEIGIEDNQMIEKIQQESTQKQNNLKQQIENDKKERNSLEEAIYQLNKKKLELDNKKNNNIQEKKRVEERINQIENEISYIILRLQTLTEKLNDISMNPKNLKTQNEYYKSLKNKMEEIGDTDEEQKKYLEDLIKNNETIEESLGISHEELLTMPKEKLAERLKIKNSKIVQI